MGGRVCTSILQKNETWFPPSLYNKRDSGRLCFLKKKMLLHTQPYVRWCAESAFHLRPTMHKWKTIGQLHEKVLVFSE